VRKRRIPAHVLYMRFIRKLPCCICARCREVDAVKFGGGVEPIKFAKHTLPVCKVCRKRLRKLGTSSFAIAHHLRPDLVIARLNELWDEQTGGKAA
jgi:hypothetical protein